MNYKRWFGLLLVVAGLVLIVFSFHAMAKITEAKTMTQNFKDFFSNNPTWNPIIQYFGGTLQKKASVYDNTVTGCLIAGITSVVVGTLLAVFSSGHKNKH